MALDAKFLLIIAISMLHAWTEQTFGVTFDLGRRERSDGPQCDENIEWQCLDKISCVDIGRRCDGYEDCIDGSDENEDLCYNFECLGSQFQCADRILCIDKSRVCDGYKDCSDNSDELECREDAELICTTWPDSSNYGCTAEGDDWVRLDKREDGRAKCESLCRQNASSEGCCFVSGDYGCFWKNGAKPIISNDENEETFAVACTFSSESPGYILINSNGICKHTNGSDLPSCYLSNFYDLDSTCRSYCTNRTSCVGYAYRNGSNCFLYQTDDSSCPSGDQWSFDRGTIDSSFTSYDLVPFIYRYPTSWVCYGKYQVDCEWGSYGEWSSCSKTCGGGKKSRTRQIKIPAYGGQPCEGEATERETCNTDLCPVNCEWGPYGKWSSCSQTCGGGEKSRTRLVSQPASNGGQVCEGESTQTMSCNEDACSAKCWDRRSRKQCRNILMKGACRKPFWKKNCCRSCRAGCGNLWSNKRCQMHGAFCRRSNLIRKKCRKTCRRC